MNFAADIFLFWYLYCMALEAGLQVKSLAQWVLAEMPRNVQ